MDNPDTALRYFSSCPLCGHFLTTLLSALGDEALDNAFENAKGGWLVFEWDDSLLEALIKYYDWHIEPGIEQHGNHCPSCYRRLIFSRTEEGTELQIERRPGYRA